MNNNVELSYIDGYVNELLEVGKLNSDKRIFQILYRMTHLTFCCNRLLIIGTMYAKHSTIYAKSHFEDKVQALPLINFEGESKTRVIYFIPVKIE